MIGTKLAHYQITGHLGSGGMGEVYQATDSKLGRSVAIKILPEAFGRDADRLARFEREARLLASLNHPNIAAIYGIEQAASQNFLVMELVNGETLAERITRGPIPIEEALPIAREIAEALEYAHERGIVHRDLKPANIKLTGEGQVKVLDFGLGKALSEQTPAVIQSNSSTLTVAPTQAGIILGTAAYMAPEQAKGQEVDRRADIWSFGIVVYEMLSGRRMFDEPTTSETLAAVLKSELKLVGLPDSTPAAVRRLLGRCLDRDRRQRLRDIGEARIVIEQAITHPETEAPPVEAVVPAPPIWGRLLPWAVAVAAAAVASVSLWMFWHTKPKQFPIVRLSSELGADATLYTLYGSSVSLSPDGKVLAFAASKTAAERPQIYVRRLDQLQGAPLVGTQGARDPFFSPDGQWIGFFADTKLKKISVNGGAAVELADAPDDRGGTWADDGTIIFSPNSSSGLVRISSDVGKPEPLTKVDQSAGESHRWPQALPGGRGVLFVAGPISANFEDADIVVQSREGGERRLVQHGGYYPRYLPSGHLVYMHQGTLFTAPFNLDRLEIASQPVPAVEGVAASSSFGGAQFSFSQAGSFVYVPGANTNPMVSIQWMDRSGNTQPLLPMLGNFFDVRFSPDGQRIAMSDIDQQQDVWVYEWARDMKWRLTDDPLSDRYPIWTPDGQRITFGSVRGNRSTFGIYWQRTDKTGEPQRLTESNNNQIPMSWHPKEKFLALRENRPQTNWDIMILPVAGDEASGWKPGKPTVFLATPFIESEAAFSPDGRWLAYQSDESGRNEVYVRPFPSREGKWQISSGGGELPTWSRKELFYRTTDQRIWAVGYNADGDSFNYERPHQWSDGTFTDRGARIRNFDLHPDGQRFAVLKAPQTQAENKLDKVTFIFNFFDELRQIAPRTK
jgi:Tol biopolymer transport system component